MKALLIVLVLCAGCTPKHFKPKYSYMEEIKIKCSEQSTTELQRQLQMFDERSAITRECTRVILDKVLRIHPLKPEVEKALAEKFAVIEKLESEMSGSAFTSQLYYRLESMRLNNDLLQLICDHLRDIA